MNPFLSWTVPVLLYTSTSTLSHKCNFTLLKFFFYFFTPVKLQKYKSFTFEVYYYNIIKGTLPMSYKLEKESQWIKK